MPIEKTGTGLFFDMSGSNPPCAGPMNSVIATTWSSVYLAMKHIFPEVPINAGTFAPLHTPIRTARCASSRVSTRPRSSREFPPISPRATPAATTTPRVPPLHVSKTQLPVSPSPTLSRLRPPVRHSLVAPHLPRPPARTVCPTRVHDCRLEIASPRRLAAGYLPSAACSSMYWRSFAKAESSLGSLRSLN